MFQYAPRFGGGCVFFFFFGCFCVFFCFDFMFQHTGRLKANRFAAPLRGAPRFPEGGFFVLPLRKASRFPPMSYLFDLYLPPSLSLPRPHFFTPPTPSNVSERWPLPFIYSATGGSLSPVPPLTQPPRFLNLPFDFLRTCPSTRSCGQEHAPLSLAPGSSPSSEFLTLAAELCFVNSVPRDCHYSGAPALLTDFLLSLSRTFGSLSGHSVG